MHSNTSFLLSLLALFVVLQSTTAHVTTVTRNVTTGSQAVYLRVPHGCSGATTLSVHVTLPANITSAKPQFIVGWKLAFGSGPLTFNWTVIDPVVNGLPDNTFMDFGVRMTIPASYAVGSVLYFPVVQTCTNSTDLWVDIPNATVPSPANVAPSLLIVSTTAQVINNTITAASSSSDWQSTDTVAVVALILSAVSLFAVLFVFFVRRPSSTTNKNPTSV